jgi:hypothetical protein
MICPHKAFAIQQDVHRLSDDGGDTIKAYTFAAQVTCVECGLEFKPFQVKLEPQHFKAPSLKFLPQGVHPLGKRAN